ncbi:extracellular matrix protein 2-like [Arapaima gigas]
MELCKRMYGIVFCLCTCALAASTDKGPLTRRRPGGSTDSPTPGADREGSRQCLVNGISLFEGAMWSPEPCSTCCCERGAASCTYTPCPVKVLSSEPRMATTWKTAEETEGEENGRKNDGGDKLQDMNFHQFWRSAADGKRQELTQQMADSGKIDYGGPNMAATPSRLSEEAGGATERGFPTANKPQSLRKTMIDKDDDDDDDDDDKEEDDDDDDGEKNISVGHLPSIQLTSRSNFMESLPTACVLAESLIACGGIGMTRLPIITALKVKTLFLADNKISLIPLRGLAGLPNMEWLDLSKNRLEDSSLSPRIFQNLTNLKRLILNGNKLTKIPLLPPSLEELKINDNKISGLTPHSFRGLSKLHTLELQGNGLHEGNVSPLTFRPLRRAVYLQLDDNHFRALPSGLPPSLQELHLSNNQLENVQEGILDKCPQLLVLDLSRNRIQEDHIAPRAWIHLRTLEALDISHNKLSQVPLFLPIALRQLTLHYNQIKHIPGSVFSHLHPGLESLSLSHNELREEGVHAVSFLGLQHSLTELLLDHNQLQTIPPGLPALKALQLLRLDHNLIRDVPLGSICDKRVYKNSPLVSVHLEKNLIDWHLTPTSVFSCINTNHSIIL